MPILKNKKHYSLSLNETQLIGLIHMFTKIIKECGMISEAEKRQLTNHTNYLEDVYIYDGFPPKKTKKSNEND